MKERLTGAIILVVLIVLLVPELLSGPSRSAAGQQQSAATPPPTSEEPPLRSYTIDLADESRAPAGTPNPSAQANGPQPSTIVESPPTTPLPASDAPARESVQTPGPPQNTRSGQSSPAAAGTASPIHTPAAPAEQPQPAPARHTPPTERSEASPSGGWMVQLGVFAKHENADRLARELKGQGFHTLVSEIHNGGRTLWRVRAGPVAEHAAAEQLGARLRAAGHAGSVVPK